MSRQAMKGIGQVIKANTTEKSIDELRAEGKHRVRVVSSERVMAIIQASLIAANLDQRRSTGAAQ